MIDLMARCRLLLLARTALEARVHRRRRPAIPPDLQVPAAGVFVTIRWRGELRGCLGTLTGDEPLGDAIARLASAVAYDDPRFPPVTAAELEMVTIDLSVLTSPEPLDETAAIVVGRHGLIVEQGRRRGLLLPQVAAEHGWDRETFLTHTCLKAGLSADAWCTGAALFRFEAEVFGEPHA